MFLQAHFSSAGVRYRKCKQLAHGKDHSLFSIEEQN